jgi:hypothetical protein
MSDAEKFRERVHHQLNTFEIKDSKEVRVSSASVKRAMVRRSIEEIQEKLQLQRELEGYNLE